MSPEQIALDNERWERIFREKFQDPHYYTVRPTAQSGFDAFAYQLEMICEALRPSRQHSHAGVEL
jgi:hypothetical protein